MIFNNDPSQSVSFSFGQSLTGPLSFSPAFTAALNPAVRQVTLGEAIKETIAAKTRQNLRASYVKGLKQYLALFSNGRENVPLASITVHDLIQWFDTRGERNSSRASNAGRLSAMFGVAMRRGWVAENPVKRLDPIRIDRKIPLVLTPEQCERLLIMTWERKPKYLAFLVLAMFAGIRPQEVPRLGGWSTVDLEAGTVCVSAAASKVRTRRIVHLMPAAVEWLKFAKEHDSALMNLCPQGIRRFRWNLKKYIRVWDWPQDVLRHTCASYWLAETQNANMVSLNLGNSPKILLTHYNGLVTKDQAAKFWTIRPPKLAK